MNTIEQESTEKTGLRSDVVTLYNGGQYHLYRYKKYTDVRLVFAPEEDAAFFGGDPDNFEYPRYDLDICFFRVYENGKPAKIEHYLQWAPAGAADGELIFVSGHPGKTDRMDTVAHLDYHPRPFAAHGAELADAQRGAAVELQPAERRERAAGPRGIVLHSEFAQGPDRPTGRAARSGRSWRPNRRRKRPFATAVAADASLRASTGSAWDDIAAALKVLRGIRKDEILLEEGRAFRCRQFQLARTLVRMAEEDGKPNADRLREYPPVEPRIARADALLRSADLRRPGNDQAGRRAEHVRHRGGRRQRPGRRTCSTASRRAIGRPN